MKKIAIAAAALLLALNGHAQLNKGRVLLGGTIGFSSTDNDYYLTGTQTNTKVTNVEVAPFAGLFVKNSLLAGVGFTYGHGQAESPTAAYNMESNIAGVNLLVRRYFPMGKSFFLYLNGGAGYRHSQTDYNYPGAPQLSSARVNAVDVSVYPGIAFNFGKRMLLEANLTNLISIGYTSSETKDGAGNRLEKQRTFDAGIGAGGSLPLNIGFNILLGK